MTLVGFPSMLIVTILSILKKLEQSTTPSEHENYQLGQLGGTLTECNWDLSLAATSLAAIALGKGQWKLARAITILEDPSTLAELLETY